MFTAVVSHERAMKSLLSIGFLSPLLLLLHNFCYEFFVRLLNHLSHQTAGAASTERAPHSISVEFYLIRRAVDSLTLTDVAPKMKWNQSQGGNCSYWKDNSLKEIGRKVTKMTLVP